MTGLEVAYYTILQYHNRIFALNMRKFWFILPEEIVYIEVQLLGNILYLNEYVCGAEISNSIFWTHNVIILILSTVLYTAGIH